MSRPDTAAQAIEWANATPPRACWYTGSSGLIELAITLDDARSGYHPGPCDGDITELRKAPYIAGQLAGIDAATLRKELREWGAWDDVELADHESNLDRLLWLACGNIVEDTSRRPAACI